MRALGVAAGAAAAITLVGSLGTATPASASDFGVELNGTYRLISNGEWAKSSAGPHGVGGAEVFIDQPTVVQTWTVTTSCTSSVTCTGEVSSDQGWTAPIGLGGARVVWPTTPGPVGDFWNLDRVIENWMPCPDGTAAPGNQTFLLWGWDAVRTERNLKNVDLLVGYERTMAPSGACGSNKPVVIEYPVRMERL
jgi:hypothetical protein